MSIKNGFGNLTDTLVSNSTRDVNRNAIIQIPPKNPKRIITISCGYTVAPGAGAATVLSTGRLIVVATKFSGFSENINPITQQIPDSISSATIHLDLPILASRSPFVWDSGLGISIGDGDVSIILTYCRTTGGTAVAPDTDPVTAWLNVQGTIGGSDKIFKDVR